MTRLLALLTFLLLSTAAIAQETIINTKGTPPGTYYARIDVAADGSVTVTQIPADRIVHLDGKPTPPPVDPEPDVLSARAKEVAAAAAKATADPQRASTAVGLSVAAKSVKALVDDGTLKSYQQISQALAYLWDATAPNAAWKDTRTLVFNGLATLAQEGAQASAYSAALRDVELGLKASIPVEQLQSGDLDEGSIVLNGQPVKADWETIIAMLLKIFVELILPLIIT